MNKINPHRVPLLLAQLIAARDFSSVEYHVEAVTPSGDKCLLDKAYYLANEDKITKYQDVFIVALQDGRRCYLYSGGFVDIKPAPTLH